jgi:hypothetical protein
VRLSPPCEFDLLVTAGIGMRSPMATKGTTLSGMSCTRQANPQRSGINVQEHSIHHRDRLGGFSGMF